jgi:murein DD-endopeptidase MepM/ murein hydrolase activator NlpD
VAVLTFILLTHNLANIGGNLTLAFNTPKPVIDATTIKSVQSPIEFSYESRGYAWYHTGVDLVAPTGTKVVPVMEGEVEATESLYFGFGKHVIVKHEEGFKSIYAHLSKIEVKPGQKVGLASRLGLSGSTGFSTGPHLHLEIHKDGVPINPAEIVPGVR